MLTICHRLPCPCRIAASPPNTQKATPPRVCAHQEGGDVHDLLAHADVALADEHARVVDALGQAQLEDQGLWGGRGRDRGGGRARARSSACITALVLALHQPARTSGLQTAAQGAAALKRARLPPVLPWPSRRRPAALPVLMICLLLFHSLPAPCGCQCCGCTALRAVPAAVGAGPANCAHGPPPPSCSCIAGSQPQDASAAVQQRPGRARSPADVPSLQDASALHGLPPHAASLP